MAAITKKNYLSKDYLTLREELLAKLPLITDGKWTDLNESDPGIALLELFFSAVDNLMFYLDMTGLELDIEQAKQRANVLRLLRLIGYETTGISAAKGTVTCYVAATESPVYPVTVQKGTQVSAQGIGNQTLVFTTTESAVLTSSIDSKTIPIVQGTTKTDTFISDGTPTQKFLLSQQNIDKTTVEIYVDDNILDTVSAEKWEMVSSFYNSDYTSKHFKVQVDEFSRVFVIFGDGQFGFVPPIGSQIYASYIVSDGKSGNIGRFAISRVLSGAPLVSDVKGSAVKLSVANSEATAGGSDVETLEHAKNTAIGLLRGLNRAMTKDDYMSLALSVPSVDKAVAWGENEELNPDYRLLNRVRVSFFSNQYSDMYFNPASRASYRSLRDNHVRKLLTKKMPITTRLVFIDPILVDIYVTLNVGIDLNKYDPNIVLDQIRSSINDEYNIDNVLFGQDIRISKIQKLVNDVEGVSWSRVTRLHTTPPNSTPDTAPIPPIDVILEKWKIPNFVDTPANSVVQTTSGVTPPYIQFELPISSAVGINDVTIINPDDQSDIVSGGFAYFPGTNLKHVSIAYSGIVDEPAPTGGYFGSPNQESDLTTFSPIE